MSSSSSPVKSISVLLKDVARWISIEQRVWFVLKESCLFVLIFQKTWKNKFEFSQLFPSWKKIYVKILWIFFVSNTKISFFLYCRFQNNHQNKHSKSPLYFQQFLLLDFFLSNMTFNTCKERCFKFLWSKINY